MQQIEVLTLYQLLPALFNLLHLVCVLVAVPHWNQLMGYGLYLRYNEHESLQALG